MKTNLSFLKVLGVHVDPSVLGHQVGRIRQRHHRHRMTLGPLLVLLDLEGQGLHQFPSLQWSLVSTDDIQEGINMNKDTSYMKQVCVCMCSHKWRVCQCVCLSNPVVQWRQVAQVDLLCQDHQESHTCPPVQASLAPPAGHKGQSHP